MKNKLYRVLVMLLVVAMAIPAFALADDVTFTTTAKDTTIELTVGENGTRYRSLNDVLETPFTYTLTGADPVGVKWTVDKEDIVRLDGQSGTGTDVMLPRIQLYDVGVVKITGQPYNTNDAPVGEAKSFTLTLTEKKITKVTAAPESVKVAKKDAPYSLNNLFTCTVDPADATYANGKRVWFIDEGAEYATVTNDGRLTTEKAGTVKLHAEINGVKSNAVSVVITDSDPGEETEKAYTALAFTSSKITAEGGYLADLASYVNCTPAYVSDDSLVFSVDDPTVAEVYYDEWDGEYDLQFKKFGEVKLTVRSYNNPDVKSEPCTVTYAKAEQKAYTALEFKPDTAKFDLDDVIPHEDYYGEMTEPRKTVNAWEYLKGTPEDAIDGAVFVSSDPTIASVNNSGFNYGAITFKKAGTVTITARSVLDPKVETAKPLTITIVDEKTAFTKVEFTKDTVNVNVEDNGFDLNDYLKLEDTYYYDDKLIWTSSNQQIALVNGGKLTFLDEGTVTITVRSELDPTKTDSIEVVVKGEEKKPFTKITLTQKEFKLDPTSINIYLGRYVVTEPADANDWLEFTSDDTDILTVEDGYLYIKADLWKPGTAHVTVRSGLNPELKEQFTFILEEVDALKSVKFVDVPKQFAKSSKDNYLGQYVVTDPADYTGVLVWESSDPQVATVGKYTGELAFVKPGTVTITVSSKDGKISDSCTIEMVDNEKVEKITLKPLTLKVGEEFGLEEIVKVEPYGADWSIDDLYWVSSDRHVAELIKGDWVDDIYSGDYIFALEAGKTKLTAYYKNSDGTVIQSEPVTVKVIENKMTDVRISKNQYTLKLNTKKYGKIKFNTVPFDAEWDEGDIYVESSDPSVVRVNGYEQQDDNRGAIYVEALKPGAVKITVYSAETNKALDVTKVVVKMVAVKSAKLPVKEIKLYWYDDGTGGNMPKANRLYQNEYELTPVVMPSTAYYKVSYETSDPSVAFVRDQKSLGSNDSSSDSNSATIVASGEGKCKITVKISDGKKVITKTLKVVVLSKKPAVKMSKSKATIKMVEGGDNTLQLRAYNADTDKDVKVTWTTSDKKVAKVDAKGVVTAVGAGKAVISATTKDNYKITVTCTVTVKADKTNDEKKVAVKEIEVAKKTAVKVGAKKTLEVNVKPAKATNKNVSFKSSDPSIVTVDKNGKIKGISAGEATITITAKDGSGVTAKVKVIVKK